MRSLVGMILALAIVTTTSAQETAQAESAPEGALVAPRYTIERIAFLGLERSRVSEVRKHVVLTEGDPLDEERVTISRLRLSQLGWFSQVHTRVDRGSARGYVVLIFELVERNTLRVSDLYIGSTEAQDIYGGLGLTDRNLLGRGLSASASFVYGGSPSQLPLDPARYALRASIAAPEVNVGLAANVLLGVSLLRLRGDELTCLDAECEAFEDNFSRAPRLRYSRTGGAADAALRVSPFARLRIGLRAEHLKSSLAIRGADRDGGIGAVPNLRDGASTLAALTVSYARDTRDDLFLPRSGSRIDLATTLGSRALGGDYEYARWLAEGEVALPAWRDHALRLQAAVGVVQGDAPFFERFYAADWAYFSLGPALGRALELNFSTDARYDAALSMLGAEYAIPLWSGGRAFERGYLALGARWVRTTAEPGQGARTDLSRSPFSAEVALRFDTPIGSFNLSAGYALDNFI